ncbi:MAG: twin-arginine translocase subunit TatC [Candidatus Bathyarchaeia archaeon]
MSIDDEKSIWDHIDELAKRLRRIIFSVAASTILVLSIPGDFASIFRLDFSNYKPMISIIIESIKETLLPEGVSLIALNWLDTFTIFVIVGLVIGILVSLPVIAYEIYQFISPALYPHEREALFKFVGAFSALFIVGVVYAYFLLLPITFNVLLRFVYQTGAVPLFSILDFFNIIAVGLIGSGLFYTLPLVIYITVKMGIIDVQTLRGNRRKVFVGLAVVTAILTPDPSPFSMMLMTLPFYLIYELTIQIVSRIKRKEHDQYTIEKGRKASRKLLEGKPKPIPPKPA